MRQVVGGVGALLVQAVRTAVDLQAAVLEPAAFGGIGAAVGGAVGPLRQGHDDALHAVLAGLQQLNGDVRRVADSYADLDAEVAAGFDAARAVSRTTDTAGGTVHAAHTGTPVAGAGGVLAGLWGSGVGTTVAAVAGADAGPGEPRSVSTVVDYLRAAGVGRAGHEPLPGDAFSGGPAGFGDWLDADPAHQTHVGVIHVYRGDVRALADIPGGVRAGDVVVVDPDLVAVATAGGPSPSLVNHGPVTADLGTRAPVRVYRPL